MQNQNSIDEYSNVFKIRKDNLEKEKQHLQDEYVKELERLKQEHEERIKKLEEKENIINLYEEIDYENITIEDIEDLLNKIGQLELTEDEELIVITKLTELSTLELVKENEEVVEEKPVEIKIERLDTKPVEIKEKKNNYYKEYLLKYEEYRWIIVEYYSLFEKFNNKENIISNLKKQIKKDKSNGVSNEYYLVVSMINKLTAGIESDSIFIKNTAKFNKKTINTKEEEFNEYFKRIKEDVEKFKELLITYDDIYEKYKKEIEDTIFEKLKESETVTEIINNENIDNLEEQEIEIPQDLEIEEVELEEKEDIFDIDEEEYKDIDEEVIQDFEKAYDNALLLYNNMKDAIEKELIDVTSYLYHLYFSLELQIDNRPPKDSTKEDIIDATDNINRTVLTIEGTVDDDLRDKLFPKNDQEHINIGPKNIVVFLDNNGEYIIEKDLNYMVTGDKKLAKKALQNGIESKYTVRSWNNDLREKSDRLKGSKIRLGNETSEAWNCRCCSGKTRISLVPLSVNQEIKNKIKEAYNLTDEFENVFLVGGITRTHRVDEELKPQINNNSDRIREINEMFNNGNIDFSEIEAIINGSSDLCERLFDNEKVSKGVK